MAKEEGRIYHYFYKITAEFCCLCKYYEMSFHTTVFFRRKTPSQDGCDRQNICYRCTRGGWINFSIYRLDAVLWLAKFKTCGIDSQEDKRNSLEFYSTSPRNNSDYLKMLLMLIWYILIHQTHSIFARYPRLKKKQCNRRFFEL